MTDEHELHDDYEPDYVKAWGQWIDTQRIVRANLDALKHNTSQFDVMRKAVLSNIFEAYKR